ncbi:MAG: NUDIX domain-containing protein [Flavobacteriaceae bacterium]
MNPTINILSEETLSEQKYNLKKFVFEYQEPAQEKQIHTREVFHRGNGAAILLYNNEKKTVLLTRQFRMPTYLNGNPSGMLIEACAGTLDEDNPKDCIIRETKEETGYHIKDAEKVFEVYVSPGAVTELMHLYIAEYSPEMKLSRGGGLEEENENIQNIELPFEEALEMVKSGEIKDAKTVLLLQYLQIKNLTTKL